MDACVVAVDELSQKNFYRVCLKFIMIPWPISITKHVSISCINFVGQMPPYKTDIAGVILGLERILESWSGTEECDSFIKDLDVSSRVVKEFFCKQLFVVLIRFQVNKE